MPTRAAPAARALTATTTPRPTRAPTRSGARRRSRRALARLPDADRDTLLLYALSDLTYEEVAEALEVPVGTVRSRLARARTRALAALGDPRPQEHDDG